MKTKITFQNRLYQDKKKKKKKKKKQSRDSLYLCLSNIVFTVSIKWYFLE